MDQNATNNAPETKPDVTTIEPIMKYFAYDHLPEKLRAISRPFCELAENIILNLPRNAERTVALRKLLESKDCAVRANLP